MNILMITYPLSAILILVVAFGLGFLITRKFKLSWKYFWIGAGTFVFSQILHIPFNAGVGQLVNTTLQPTGTEVWIPIFQAVFLGLSSGFFEEVSRYIMYRFWAKDARSWAKGVLAGAGHGGIEAVFVAGLILLGFINAVVSQSLDLTSLGLPPEQLAEAQEQLSAYWSAPWLLTMLSFVERMFAIPLHIALSVLVLQVFVRKQLRWLGLAIFWHALVNGVAVYFMYQWQGRDWMYYALEGVVGVFALLSIAIIFALRRPEPVELDPASLPPVEPPPFEPPLIDETPENLDKTRYQ